MMHVINKLILIFKILKFVFCFLVFAFCYLMFGIWYLVPETRTSKLVVIVGL